MLIIVDSQMGRGTVLESKKNKIEGGEIHGEIQGEG
jgi:hypothetical protein